MSLVCTSSAELLDHLQAGKAGPHRDDRREDRPRRREPSPSTGSSGSAHAVARRRFSVPSRFHRLQRLRVSGSDPRVLQAAGIEWRSVSEITNADAQVATTAADIAVMAVYGSDRAELARSARAESGLPKLPPFMVNLYLPKDGGDHIARELARISAMGSAQVGGVISLNDGNPSCHARP